MFNVHTIKSNQCMRVNDRINSYVKKKLKDWIKMEKNETRRRRKGKKKQTGISNVHTLFTQHHSNYTSTYCSRVKFSKLAMFISHYVEILNRNKSIRRRRKMENKKKRRWRSIKRRRRMRRWGKRKETASTVYHTKIASVPAHRAPGDVYSSVYWYIWRGCRFQHQM